MQYRFLLPFLVVWLVLVYSPPAFSQQSHFSFSFSQRVGFVPNPNAEEAITNDLLQHIAEGSGRLRAMVSYNIAGSLGLSIENGTNGKIFGVVMLENLSVNGDMRYRDFSIAKVLIPDLVSFELLLKGNNEKVIFKEKLTRLTVNEPGGVLHRFELPRVNSNSTFKPEISEIHFSYSHASYGRLNTWFGHLDEYYRAGGELTTLLQEVSQISFADPSRLILSEFALCEAERRLENIARMGFFKGMRASEGDPDGVFGAYEKVKNLVHGLRQNFNEQMAVIDSLLYENGRELLNRRDLPLAIQRFEAALTLNPFHVPSHLALAEIDFAHGNKTGAINRLSDVFSKMFPYGEWRRKAEVITDTVMTQFFHEAFDLNREGRFKESLDLMAPLESFCEKTQGYFNCPGELNFRLTQAHLGMYRSYLVVGNRALRNDNLNMCRIYTIAAIDYQQNHTEFLPNASEAYDILQQVISRNIDLAIAHFDAGRYLQASGQYQDAIDLCSRFADLYCAPNLQLRQQLALDMHERQQAMAANEPASASIPPQPEALNLQPMPDQTRQELLDRIRFGQLQAWAGNLDAAREAQQDALRISRRFRLDADHLIIYELNELDSQIKEKECEITSRRVADLVARGVSFLNTGEILLAAQSGHEALALVQEQPDCNANRGIDPQDLTILHYAATFMVMINEAQSYYLKKMNGNYIQTLSKYHEAERFLMNNLPQAANSDRYRLVTFISLSGNEEFIRSGIMFMADYASMYDAEIVQLLNVLRNAGVDSRQVRALQSIAGRSLSAHYSAVYSDKIPQQIIQNLTGGQKWFRVFEREFIRNWKGN